MIKFLSFVFLFILWQEPVMIAEHQLGEDIEFVPNAGMQENTAREDRNILQKILFF